MSTDFIWENKDNIQPIVLTVALPALKAEQIIWLALTSLSNQEKIDFGWELIIWEEYAKSADVIKSFIGKLKGCQKIIHKNIDPVKDGRQEGKYKGTFLLIDKWIGMAKQSSETSKIFALQAADCYSSPHRLYIHHEHFKNKKCFFSTQPKGIFYNILTGKSIIYNGYGTDTPILKRTHLNMAMLTNDMKKIKTIEKNKKIDNYLLTNIKKIHKIKKTDIGYIFSDDKIDKSNWKKSLDTDGYNNISLSRTIYYNKESLSFKNNNINIKQYIPGQVLLYLNDLKTFKQPKFKKIYDNIIVKSSYKHKYITAAKQILNNNIITYQEFDEFTSYVNKVDYLS